MQLRILLSSTMALLVLGAVACSAETSDASSSESAMSQANQRSARQFDARLAKAREVEADPSFAQITDAELARLTAWMLRDEIPPEWDADPFEVTGTDGRTYRGFNSIQLSQVKIAKRDIAIAQLVVEMARRGSAELLGQLVDAGDPNAPLRDESGKRRHMSVAWIHDVLSVQIVDLASANADAFELLGRLAKVQSATSRYAVLRALERRTDDRALDLVSAIWGDGTPAYFDSADWSNLIQDLARDILLANDRRP